MADPPGAQSGVDVRAAGRRGGGAPPAEARVWILSGSRCEYATRAGRLHTAAVHHDGAVHDDVGNAGRITVRLGERRLVLDGAWIEDREVGGVAFAHEPAVAQAKPCGAHACHLVDGRLEREQALVAGILAEHPPQRALPACIALSPAL